MILFILATFLLPILAHAEEIAPCTTTVVNQEVVADTSDHPLSLPLQGGGENTSSLTQSNDLTLIINAPSTPRLPQSGELRINELLPIPPGDASEWVEIKNESTIAFSLEGVTLVDGADHRVALGGALEPNQFSLITLTNAILNNNGDRVALALADGTIIDEIFYGDWETTARRAPKTTATMSLSRFGNEFLVTTPSPNADNIAPPPPPPSAPTPTPSPELSVLPPQGGGVDSLALPVPATVGSVLFSELYPFPYQGEEEWLELWNTTTNTITLDGWKIIDASNRATPLSGSLTADARLVIPSPRGALNNDGDNEHLLDATGTEIDAVAYGSDIKRGEAYVWSGARWQRSIRPTPATSNIIIAPETEKTPAALTITTSAETEEPISDAHDDNPPLQTKIVKKTTATKKKTATIHEVSLDEVRGLPMGSIVRTEGIVSVEPGILGKRIAYLAGSGIQIYFHTIEPPILKIGDVVRIEGKLGTNGAETRITISKSGKTVVQKNGGAPLPEPIALDEITDETEGWLIETKGVVAQKLKNAFVIEDGGASILVVQKSNALMNAPAIGIGDTVTVRGVVSKTKNGLRLLPRFPDDLAILEKALPPPPPRRPRLTFLIPLAALMAIILSGFVIRQYYLEKIKNQKEEKTKPLPFPV